MDPDKEQQDTESRLPVFSRAALILAGGAAFLALAALVGWVFGIRFLTSFRESYFPMAPSTGIGLLLLCGALAAWIYRPAERPFEIDPGGCGDIRVQLVSAEIMSNSRRA